MDPEEEARLAAEAEAARIAAEKEAADAEAARLAAEKEAADKDKNKPSDAEAALLKDVMKQKKVAADAKAALEAANARLKEFEGFDAAKVRELVAAQEEAERKEAEKRGEYDRIVAQMREQSEKALEEQKKASEATAAALAEAQARIDQLTLGQSFANSKFLAEKTILTPVKARKLYDEHFDLVDGETVAFDKPRGTKDRTPLVNARGENLDFEAAIEKIVSTDPDFERIAKAKLKAGPGSNPKDIQRDEQQKDAGGRGVQRIQDVLKNRTKK